MWQADPRAREDGGLGTPWCSDAVSAWGLAGPGRAAGTEPELPAAPLTLPPSDPAQTGSGPPPLPGWRSLGSHEVLVLERGALEVDDPLGPQGDLQDPADLDVHLGRTQDDHVIVLQGARAQSGHVTPRPRVHAGGGGWVGGRGGPPVVRLTWSRGCA